MRNRVTPFVCWIAILGLLLAGVTKLGDARQTKEAVATAPQKTIEYVEWERSVPPAWLVSAEDTDIDSVRANLATRVKVKCENKPLHQALKLVEAQIDTKILINDLELGVCGIDVDSPITVEASGKLKDVLDLMLAEVENADAGLTWRLLPIGIQITSKEHADSEPETRTFDLTYFLPGASHAGDLAMLVTQHVDPDSWMVAGGMSVISHFGSQLVVTAPSSQMQRIESLLTKISKQDRDHLKAPKFKEDTPVQKKAPETPAGHGDKNG